MLGWIIFFSFICVVVFAEWMREIHSFRMTHYQIRSNKLNGIKKERKIIFLSDLHNCTYGKGNQKLLDAIAKENPDLILVAGDMVVGKTGVSTKVAEDFMIKLAKICEVYHANGNHEQRMKEFPEEYEYAYEAYETVLKKGGVHLLSNKKVLCEWDNIPVEIYGLELPHEKYRKFQKNHCDLEELQGFLGTSDKEKYQILIAHNPTFMDSYLEWGADLVVSGHLHGGVVRIPRLGGIISPQFILFPKYSGEMKKVKDAVAVVSKGIGIHTIKIRLLNPAEVVVMHIDGMEE